MLTGDDLSTQYFLAGTAVAVLGIAMTQAGWTHRLFVRSMFGLGGTLAVCAFLWKPITETFPRIGAIANPIGSSSLAWLTLVMVGLGVTFWLDYRARIGIKHLRGSQQPEPDVAALNNALQGLFERVGNIELAPAAAAASDHKDLKTTVIGLMRDHFGDFEKSAESINELKSRLDRLEKSAANPAANPQIVRDLLLLMHFAVHQSTVLMLDDLLTSAPDGMTIDAPLSLGGDFVLQNAAAKEFIDLIRRKLDPGSWRRSNFENVLHTAASEAEYSLEQTPINERPSGIDPLALRRWAIAHRQCAKTILFLKHEKKEAEENLLTQRFNLLQRYAEQNKG